MKLDKIIIIIVFLVILFNSIVYSALNSEMFINGDAHIRVDKDIRITDVKILEQTQGAYEIYNSDYSKNTTSMQVSLPSKESFIIYEVTITNKDDVDYEVDKIIEESYSNNSISYELINMETGSSYAYRGIKRRNSSNGAIGGNCGYVSGERELEFFVGGGGGGYIGGEGIVANDGQWTSPSWPLFLRGMAAGGTGYVGGVESSIIYGVEAKTIGGNMEIPTYDSLSTMTGNLGNGYAKIMLMGKIN